MKSTDFLHTNRSKSSQEPNLFSTRVLGRSCGKQNVSCRSPAQSHPAGIPSRVPASPGPRRPCSGWSQATCPAGRPWVSPRRARHAGFGARWSLRLGQSWRFLLCFKHRSGQSSLLPRSLPLPQCRRLSANRPPRGCRGQRNVRGLPFPGAHAAGTAACRPLAGVHWAALPSLSCFSPASLVGLRRISRRFRLSCCAVRPVGQGRCRCCESRAGPSPAQGRGPRTGVGVGARGRLDRRPVLLSPVSGPQVLPSQPSQPPVTRHFYSLPVAAASVHCAFPGSLQTRTEWK